MTVEERARQQYADDRKLNARIELHRRFSTSPLSWYEWVVDQLQLKAGQRVVELGAGTGLLWSENRDRLPEGLQLVLTEPSEGMLSTLRAQVAGMPGVEVRQADASHIDEPDQSLDAVVANHMLYELAYRAATFREVVRILKPTGRFFAATNGRQHMRELDQAIAHPEKTRRIATERFSLENGGEQLRPFFGSITCVRHDNRLEVTDAAAALAYVRSLSLELPESEMARIGSTIQRRIDTEGAFRIAPDTGMFICSRPIAVG